MTPPTSPGDLLWEQALECGACGSHQVRFAAAIDSRRYAICLRCGIERLYDRIAESRLGLLYDDYYAARDSEPPTSTEQLANPTFTHRLQRLEHALGDRSRRILEIGCGDGNFLAVLRNAGWDVQGQEVSAATAALVQRRLGIPIVVGPVDAISFEQQFSVVAAYHVFEHVYRPAAWLERVGKLIEPDGLLYLQVPNAASLTRLAARGRWSGLIFPQHVYLYAPPTLQRLLERYGFDLLTITTWDPWHGPGSVSTSGSNVVNWWISRRRPWTAGVVLRGRHTREPRTPAARHPIKIALRGTLERASVGLARLEAAVGRGAVVDAIARKR